ncbi:MAG: hypothetical protein OXN86_06050 [Chloroflexota bacterium]|nr:hypothetical protein [Chloroflexota bacterium]
MPNPYHFRARIDRICRRAFGNGPGYLRLNALNTLVRELHARNDRARANYQMYLATDPYDVARHQLRHLHDRASLLPPLPLGEGWGEGSPAQDEQRPDEDDDPL